MKRAACLCLCLHVIACGKNPPVVQPPTIVTRVEVQEIKVAVPVVVQPPPELLAPLTAPLPKFISPSDPTASSALDAQGERDLRGLLELYRQWREAVLAYWKTLAEK